MPYRGSYRIARSILLRVCCASFLSDGFTVLALRLHTNGPDEARQLPCDGYAGFVGLQASCIQRSKARCQSQLRCPSHRSYRLRQILLPDLRLFADARLEAVVPGGFAQQPTCVCVACLGDAAPTRTLTTGVLTGNQPKIAHELAGMGKAFQVSNLCHQANRRNRSNTTQCLQRSHHRLKAPASDRGLQRLGQTIHTVICCLHRLPVFGECRLRCTSTEVQCCQPAVLGCAPRSLACVAHVVRALAYQTPGPSARFGRCDADAVFVDVKAHVNLATLLHGRSPCC